VIKFTPSSYTGKPSSSLSVAAATELNVEPQLAAEIVECSLEELSPTSFVLAPLFEPPNEQ
jgi:hypothetical protein